MRTNLTLRWSDDGGVSYPHTRQVWAGPTGYSCLTHLHANTAATPQQAGLAFERGDPSCWGGSCRISFARLAVGLAGSL